MRVEEYLVRESGSYTTSRLFAESIGKDDLERLVKERQAKINSWLPVSYFIATAEHESNFAINERDTEPPDANGQRFQSWGIFQISEEEAKHFGFHAEDMLDPSNAVLVMVGLANRNANLILKAARLSFQDGIVDMGAYLSIAHNQGLGAALETIHLHGMDWAAYKGRNEYQAQANVAAGKPGALSKLQWWHKVFRYGDDCNGL